LLAHNLPICSAQLCRVTPRGIPALPLAGWASALLLNITRTNFSVPPPWCNK